MIGDQLQRISPFDRLIFDTEGNLAGVQSPNGKGSNGRMLSEKQFAALRDSGTISYLNGKNWVPRINPKALTAMASPPTITNLTSNALSAGQFWASTNQDITSAKQVNSPAFSYFRGGYYDLLATGFPDYFYTYARTVTDGAANNSLVVQVSFVHTGSTCAIRYKGATGHFFVKVNDEFVSLTPVTVPNDGLEYYYQIDFGSVGTRRIDFVAYNSRFGGVYGNLTDTIAPAQRRGPRMVVLSDSFGEGSGATYSVLSWISYLAEYLGWDDIVPSALGSTGMIAVSAPKTNYIGRAVRDVAGLRPSVVWVQQSLNDAASTAAAVVAACQALVTALGTSYMYVFSSPSISAGAGFRSLVVTQQNAAVKMWCAAQGYIYIDEFDAAQDGVFTTAVTTLTSAASANATALITAVSLIPGCHYKFADSTQVFVRSVSGVTATIDRLQIAQASGATLTQCGPTYLTGNGRVGATVGWGNADLAVYTDAVHPSQAGHQLKGRVCAELLCRFIASN
ncbi:MAG: hypothetical protein RL030_1780 [Pseudomonadota bacterium]